MSDEKKGEVEGQADEADVEGQGFRAGRASEAPQDADVIGEDAGEADEPEVEGQGIRYDKE